MRKYELDFIWCPTGVCSDWESSPTFGPLNEWYLCFRLDVSKNKKVLCLVREIIRQPLELLGHVVHYGINPIKFKESMGKQSSFIFLPLPFNSIFTFGAEKVRIYSIVTEMEPSDEKSNANEKEVETDSDFNMLNVSDKHIVTIDANDLTSFSQDMQTMYEENHHSDFTLICGSKTFHVHKCVLSARSPVFASMFQYPMNETVENRMIIPDIDALVLDQLVLFMYTGRIKELSYSMARDLYSASDKYAVMRLKDKCSKFLISSLCTSTAVEILILWDEHNDITLKNVAISFISDNFRDLNTTAEWLTLVKERSPLPVEVLSSAMIHLDSKLQNRK